MRLLEATAERTLPPLFTRRRYCELNPDPAKSSCAVPEEVRCFSGLSTASPLPSGPGAIPGPAAPRRACTSPQQLPPDAVVLRGTRTQDYDAEKEVVIASSDPFYSNLVTK